MPSSAPAIQKLVQSLRLPIACAPMFLVSSPQLLIAQCQAGIIGSLPSLNARPIEVFEDWLKQITSALAGTDAAPFAVNLIVSKANDRLQQDLALCRQYKVPIIITSVGSPAEVVPVVHGYGGLVFHDVVSVRHAEKAAAAGVDGIVAVCAGAGGHGGTLSPFALVREIRAIFDGAILLGGAISNGADVLAARAMGADLAYMGTRFLGTAECEIDPLYQQMLLDSGADDIVYSNLFTGIKANYLSKSVARTGLDPANMPEAPAPGQGAGGHNGFMVWKDIWGAGQGVGAIKDFPPVAELVSRLETEYRATLADLQG